MKFSKSRLKKLILNRQESKIEKRIEKKLIDWIHYPGKRNSRDIFIEVRTGRYSYVTIWVYKDELIMSSFREIVLLFYLLYYCPSHLRGKECLMKCVQYFRKLPTRTRYLYAYHRYAAQMYKSGEKAENHLRQAFRYGFSIKELKEIINDNQEDLSILIKILSYTLSDRDRENPDNLYNWNRSQYELIEKSLGEAISIYGENKDCPNDIRAYFYFCQSVYYN